MLGIAQRLLLLLVAALVLAAPAGAAEVARIDEGSLDARDGRGADLCLRLTQGAGGYGGGSGTCGRAPWRPRRSILIAWVGRGERVLAAGAVPASVTRAEAELVDGRRIGFDTVTGPRYRGRHAGRLRFFLASLPLADPRDDEAGGVVAVRFFGADGALAGVAASEYPGTLAGRRAVLLRERAGRRATTVVGETLRRIVSTPLQLDRVEELTCIGARSRFGSDETGSSSICHDAGPARPDLAVVPEAGCDGLRTVVYGFVGDAVGAVRLRLGSGRVREVRVRTLRDPQGGAHRYIAAAVPRGEAVRSVRAVGADEGYDLGEPPSGLPCDDGSSYSVVGYAFVSDPGDAGLPAGDEQVVAEAGGHRLLVRDGPADRLCVGIDRLSGGRSDCLLPAVNGEDAYALASSGVVSSVLPTEVARVRLPDGREVPTVEGGYGGRYAGTVRFLFAEAAIEGVGRIRLLDSAGAVIGTLPVYDPELFSDEPPFSSFVRLAGGRGWRLAAARHPFGACLTLRLRGEDPQCIGDPGSLFEEAGVRAAVSCTPRVAVMVGTLPKGVQAPRVVLRGGRALRPRVLRVPRRYGGGRAWVLELPRTAGVRAIRFLHGRSRALHPFTLLPAADQCGYATRTYLPTLPAPAGVALPAATARAWPGTARPRGSWSGR